MKAFTTDFGTVLATEKDYLEDRRRENDLPDLEANPDLSGLALSGGGVRSATFCLGVFQALARKGRMKQFDYMSTVSGGGYIGSCLSSLLTSQESVGLDNEHFPFTGLGDPEDCQDSTAPKLSVRHQIHHLRTHGEYLIPRSHLLSRDVQRAVGSVVSGIIHTLVLFALFFVAFVAVTHTVLSTLDPDLATLAPTSVPFLDQGAELSGFAYVRASMAQWYEVRIVPPFMEAFGQAGDYLWLLLAVAGAGLLWSLAWFIRVTRLAQSFHGERMPPDENTRSGWGPEDQLEAKVVAQFNLWSIIMAVSMMIGFALFLPELGIGAPRSHFLAGLFIPFAFSAGGFVTGQFVMHFLQSWMKRKAWGGGKHTSENRFRRSLYASLRGACIFGSVGAVVFPVVVVLLFSLKDLPWKAVLVLLSLAWAWFQSRKGGGTAIPQLGGWLKRPMANFAVLVFLALTFAWTSAWLLALYPAVASDTWVAAVITASVALGAFGLLGVFINANRIAPHYFYRDRLTEAYLKTDARTLRSDPPETRKQGMPLTNLRDDEGMRLSELGGPRRRGPYHLIVAALNLAGSKELNRKSFLSEHFIFSRDYIGSKVTGWVPTILYRGNSTRLARAMAISAAAVGSAMGRNTFGAQAFLTTLFNARLGFWMENPWTYKNADAKRRPGGLTFWPRYLLLEVLGRASAREDRVNVSDGGHTGDNLGLLPLLRRECRTIVVCDAEADPGYTFASFNNAVRMALTEENIEIEIDLNPIMTRSETPAGYMKSDKGVVVGTIHYPTTGTGRARRPGKLVYIKSSVVGKDVPVHVENYAKQHLAFPHQTTADQFFDDAQFEAYRALGEFLGEQGAAALD